MNDTTRHVPLELLKLRSATSAYLEVLEDLVPWLGQVADVNRLREPSWSELRDQVHYAIRQAHYDGTPAAIARVVATLLGEAS